MTNQEQDRACVACVNDIRDTKNGVNQLLVIVERIEGRLDSGDDRMNRHEKALEEHEHKIKGNGSPGLLERMLEVEGTIKPIRRLFWLVVGGIVVEMLGALGLAVIWIVRTMPHTP